jgi:nitrogen fixation protein FixH
MTNTAKPTNRDWWIPWSFVAFFGVVLLVNGTMIFFAMESWTGVETSDAYQKGLAYNEQIAAAEVQAEQGWHAALDYAPEGGLKGRLSLSLSDRFETPLDGARVVVALVRPAHEGQDFTVELAPEGAGRYGASVDFPLAGLWEARMTAEHERGSHRLRSRLMVRP